MAPSPDTIFPLGYIYIYIYIYIYFFFYPPPPPHKLFHVLHISNIFPGTQPKEGTDEDLQNAPMLPASMIVANSKNNLCDCCKINKAGSPHIASVHAQYTNSKLT